MRRQRPASGSAVGARSARRVPSLRCVVRDRSGSRVRRSALARLPDRPPAAPPDAGRWLGIAEVAGALRRWP